MLRALPLILLLSMARDASRADITIYRDSFGVPSIVAASTEEAVFGLGYATAQDNAERMALNYKQARGRLAEVEGKNSLLMDSFVRSLGLEAAAEKRAEHLDGEMGKLIKAFCEGANRSLAEQKGKIPAWIAPFTPVDVLSLAQLINAAFPLQDLAGQLLPSSGSNQFAVAAKRSANGHALVSADPHLPWDGILAWYEFGIDAPGYRFRGITLPGLPLGAMGHTDRVAWTMTNNSPDLFDLFTVKTNPSNPNQYSYHGEWRDFETVTYELRYLEEGELKVRRQTAKRTAWGPMVPFRTQAAAFTMIGNWDLLDDTLKRIRAKDVAEFREALRPCGVSMFNIVYADVAGKIGYQYNARVPRRDERFDWTKVVPGDDPRTKWGPLWSIDELPHVENPKSNLLVNANSAPDLTPLGPELNGQSWPKYVTHYGHTTRYDYLSALLKADQSITVEEAKKYATDTEVPYARAVKRQLDTAGSVSTVQSEALGVLKRWDGRSDLDSVGTALYTYWYRTGKPMRDLALKAEAGTSWSESEKAAALSALDQAASELKSHFGSMGVKWGEVQQASRGSAVNGVAGWGYVAGLGSDSAAAVMPTFGRFDAKSGKIQARGGSSFRMIMDLDPKGIKSWSILPYGNSNNPSSGHYADQMGLYSAGKYKPTLFGLENIKKGAASKQSLTMPSSENRKPKTES